MQASNFSLKPFTSELNKLASRTLMKQHKVHCQPRLREFIRVNSVHVNIICIDFTNVCGS